MEFKIRNVLNLSLLISLFLLNIIFVSASASSINLTLIYPNDNSIINTNLFTFNYSVNISSNCTLFTNQSSWGPKDNNSNIIGQSFFSVNLPNGNFKWNIMCVDSSNFSNRVWGSFISNRTVTVNAGGGGCNNDNECPLCMACNGGSHTCENVLFGNDPKLECGGNKCNGAGSCNGGGGSPPMINYTPLWDNRISAVSFPNPQASFSFLGAPYIARGPGCNFGMLMQDQTNLSPGQNCNNNKTGSGSLALDLGAVWVTQDSNYVAWNIVGPFIELNNLSVCGGSNNSDAVYVIEFDSDNNASTGCIGNPQSGESCYPGSDYELWYFPDDNKGLFSYYNGSQKSADGRPANVGNCSRNSGNICFAPNTSVDIMVNVTCGANKAVSNLGLVIVVNKSALPSPIQLNFETNSLNLSFGQGPIDHLNKVGLNAFFFMGPSIDKGSCFRYDNNQAGCENMSDDLSCKFNSFGGGRGMCQADFKSFTMGSSCFTYTDSTNCTGSDLGNCKWMTDSFAVQKSNGKGGLCVDDFKPTDFGNGGSCDADCFNCYSKTQCEKSNANGGVTYGGCKWYNDSFNTLGWCDAKGKKFGCSENPQDCFSQAECEGNGNTWNWSITWNVCRKDANTEICFNGADDNGNGLTDCQEDYCKTNSKFCGGGVNTLTGEFQGMDQEEALMQKLMGFNPSVINLKTDSLSDSTSNINKSTELTGFNVVVTPLGLGLGVGILNSSELKVCGGDIIDRRYMFFIDKDANTSTGCNVIVDGLTYQGVDYLIKYGDYNTINSTVNNTKQIYACYNNNLVLKDGAVLPVNMIQPKSFFNPSLGIIKNPMECGMPGQQFQSMDKPMYNAAVVVEKADIGNPTKDMKFLVISVNGSWNNFGNLRSYDKIEDIYYTPGSIGFTPVDCFKEPSKCGSEFMLIGGGKFMPFEDCMMPGDEDLDGFVNCADPDCSFAPNCRGIQGAYNFSADKTSPKVKMSKVDTFTDSAFVSWSTNKPTNASLLFYNEDSACNQLNISLWDEGIPNTPIDDFKPWHNIQINFQSINYLLTSNTTYFYTLQAYDQANNPSKSSCLNFTTEASPKNVSMKFDFIPQGNDSSGFLGNLSIELNGQSMALGDYSDKENMNNVNITFKNPSANESTNWSIELVGADLFQNLDLNFSDAFLANDSGEMGKMLGMDNAKWLDIAQNLGVDYVVLQIPDTGDKLYHCLDNGTSCVDVTNEDGVEKLNSTNTTSKWKLPITLGFSSYSAGGEGATVYNLSFMNMTSSNVTVNLTSSIVTATFTLNITNLENATRIYNLTVNNGQVNYSDMAQLNLSYLQSEIINITVNVNATGVNNYVVTAKLVNDSNVILLSSDDLTLTAFGVDRMAPSWVQLPSAQTNQYYTSFTYAINASDYFNGLPISYTINDTSNFVINASTGIITNITLLSIGVHAVNVTATDSQGNVNSTIFDITTSDTSTPYFTSGQSLSVAYASSFSYDINATDTYGVPLVYAINDSRFIINNITGVLSNNSFIDVGVYNMTLNVTDGTNYNLSFFIVTISDMTSPTFTQTPINQIIQYGNNFNYDINATDQNGTITTGLIYQINGSGSNFTINNETGVITNSTILNLGNYSLTLSVNDTRGNILSQTIVISVIDSVSPVWINASNKTVERLTPLTHQLNATDNYPNGLIYSVNDSTNFVINQTTGLLMNNTRLVVASYQITVTATDASNNTNSTRITITVQDTTKPQINSTMVNLSATNNTEGKIVLTWSNDTQEDVVKYNVYRKTTSNFVILNDSFKVDSNITILNWSDTSNKTANTTYYYVLTAVDAVGNENVSAITGIVNTSIGADCTNSYTTGEWNTCTSNSQSRTNTRTCYITGGIISQVETQSCTSSGSGSSGSSGSLAATPVETSQTASYTVLQSGTNNIEFTKEELSVTNLELVTTTDLSNVKIKVVELVAKPTETEVPSLEKNYGYLKIDHTNVDNSKIGSAKIKFKVEKSWMIQNNVEASKITLLRHTTKWDTLVTKLKSDDSKYYHFEAESPGLSYFVIGVLNKSTSSAPLIPTQAIITPSNETVSTQDVTSNNADISPQIPSKTNDETITSNSVAKKINKLLIGVFILSLIILVVGIVIYRKTKGNELLTEPATPSAPVNAKVSESTMPSPVIEKTIETKIEDDNINLDDKVQEIKVETDSHKHNKKPAHSHNHK